MCTQPEISKDTWAEVHLLQLGVLVHGHRVIIVQPFCNACHDADKGCTINLQPTETVSNALL